MIDLTTLQNKLGVSFKEPSLLKQALLHSSYVNENLSLALFSNERLEFLGDAVLGMVIAKKIYGDLPNLSEGKMTKLRAALVSRDTLVRIARTIELGDYLYLGKGEQANDGRNKPVNLAGALEAIIAAVFLDQGSIVAWDFILRLFNSEIQKVGSQRTGTDYKSQLQELTQARKQQTPSYDVVETTGPAHDRRFVVEVRLGDVVMGRGLGRSKKIAEMEAARSILEQPLTNFTQ